MTKCHNSSSRPPIHPHSPFQIAIVICSTAILSYLAARIGGALVLRPEMIWPVWPGCAFLVALLLLTPRRIWPAVLIAGLSGFALYDVQEALPVKAIALLLLADGIEILVAALGVHYVFGGVPRLNNVKSLTTYSFFAVVLAPFSVASIASSALESDSWWISFFTEALALLTLTPATLSWADIASSRVERSKARYLESALMSVGLGILSYFTFLASGSESRPTMLYSLVPFLLWSALRFGTAGTSNSIVIVGFLAILGTIHGRGPFRDGSPVHDVLSLQLFLLVAASSFMVLATVVEEHKAAEQAARKSEEALRISEERLRLAQQAARIGTFEWNIRTGVDSWTSELEVMHGLPPGGFGGTQSAWENLIHPDDLAEVLQWVDEALKTGRPMTGEWRVIWPDKSIHWIAGRWQVFTTESGEPLRMIGVNLDITERRQAENAVRESELRFKSVADTAPVLIWMSGTDKLCTYFNKPWLEFTGRTMEQETGNGWAEGVHCDDIQRCVNTYTKSFDKREKFRMEYRLRRHDGAYRWILDIGVPRFNQDGLFEGYIGISVDITEQRIAEKALAEMTRKLIEAQEQERARIGRELHDDINQRLAMLAVELERLEENPSDLQNSARELRRQTLEISSEVQALSHDLHSSKLEYLGIVAGIKSWCKEFSERQKVEIDFRSGVQSLLPIDVGRTLLRVLQEALHNASKHSGVRQVGVELRETAGEIQMIVRDSGKGFNVETALHGTGLGLTSMQERVRLVNGTIKIDSKPMHGTSIHVRVPVGLDDISERAV